MKDNVRCANCGWEGLVNCGEEMCPKCEHDGTLMWKEGEPQEVEDDYNLDSAQEEAVDGLETRGEKNEKHDRY